MTKIKSTLGFLFTPDLNKVLLIEKQKPIHHKGLLNGLGGKVDAEENTLECVIREVKEESGLLTYPDDWEKVGDLNWTEWNVEIFTSIYNRANQHIHSTEQLFVDWYQTDRLPKNCVTNLYWLIPYCIDILKTKQRIQIHIEYS